MKTQITQRIFFLASAVLFATLLQRIGSSIGIDWLYTLTKYSKAIIIWIVLLRFPFKILNDNNLLPIGNFIIKALLLCGVYQVFVTIFNDDYILNSIGNKYITLFFNDLCLFNFIAPLFAYLAIDLHILDIVRNRLQIMLVLFTVFLPIANLFAGMTFYTPAFGVFLRKKVRILVILGVFMTLFAGVFEDKRTSILVFLFGIASYVFSYYFKKKIYTYVLCVLVLILPYILFVPILYSENESVFEYLSREMSWGDDEMKTDTRSFLYREMSEDLTRTDSWLWGKGAHAHYYSHYFAISTSGYGDYHYRMYSEVTFLTFLLRGGIVYAILYYGLLIIAIIRAIYYGKSRFMQSVGILLSGWYFIHFFGDFSGFSFLHFVVFIFVGLTLSPVWINFSDNEIYKLLNNS